MKTSTISGLVGPLLDLTTVTKENVKKLSESTNNQSWSKVLREISANDKYKVYAKIRSLILFARFQSIINSISAYIRSIVISTLYIGPARAKSDRYYRYQDLSVSEIDPDGKNFPMFLNSLTANQMSGFSDWVKSLFNYGVEVLRESGHISIKLVYETGTVNVVDTGYGISQILPVLGQIWWANNRPATTNRSRFEVNFPLLVIEQPELHLHPAHQAILADAFVSSIGRLDQAGNSTTPKGASFIIETHSEALVNRLGALIADKKLSPDDVQIVIFEPDRQDANKTNVRVVPYDSDGILIDWPYDFFLPAI